MNTSIPLEFRHRLRETAARIFNQHVPGPALDIALFGSRRSGTTIMAEVIAANPGVKYIDQPLSIFSASPYQLSRLPIFPGGQFFALDEQEQGQLRSFVKDIIEGRIHVREPWRFWRSGFEFRSNRLVLKFTNAHGIAGWLNEQFELQSIVVMRHPIPQSLSIMRNLWELQGKGFLTNEKYCEAYLNNKQHAFANDILRNSSELHKHVLDWCLENLPLIRALALHPDWHLTTYEEFVLNSSAVIANWSVAFDLPDTGAMEGIANRPSLSTNRLSAGETSAAITRSDQDVLLKRWRREVDEETEHSVLKILRVFEIDLYRPGSDFPAIMGLRTPLSIGELRRT